MVQDGVEVRDVRDLDPQCPVYVDCGRSIGDPCRRAIRPIEAFKAAVCYVRNTSTPDVQSLATNVRSGAESGPTGRQERARFPPFRHIAHRAERKNLNNKKSL